MKSLKIVRSYFVIFSLFLSTVFGVCEVFGIGVKSDTILFIS